MSRRKTKQKVPEDFDDALTMSEDKKSAAAAAAVSSATTPSISSSAADLGLLEEDDDFEEFPALKVSRPEASTQEEEEAAGDAAWEDNWDDDTVEEDFCVQLRKYGRRNSLPSASHSPPSGRSPSPLHKKVCSRKENGAAAPKTPTRSSARLRSSKK